MTQGKARLYREGRKRREIIGIEGF